MASDMGRSIGFDPEYGSSVAQGEVWVASVRHWWDERSTVATYGDAYVMQTLEMKTFRLS